MVSLIAIICATRCWCRRRRLRRRRRRSIRSIEHIDAPHLHVSAQGYQPNMKPPAYESSKIVVEDIPQKPKTKKDGALPPIPTEETPRKKKALDQEYDQGMELDRLKAAPTPIQPVATNQPAQLEDGLIPLKTPQFKNPFEVPAPAPADNKNPFDASSLGENHDYNPISPVSPQRSYSPFSPSNYTRYTTSPFNDPPSRQSTPFSSAASMRTVSYVPPPSPYMAYSSSTAIPQSPSLLDEPKSPYRAYSPLLAPRYEFSAPTPPPAVVDPPAETAPQNVSSLNHEPLEMSTSYNMRPQSMALEGHSHRGQPNPSRGELPSEETASMPHELSEKRPVHSTPAVASERPQEHHLELPQELPTRNSAYGEVSLPLGKPASSTDPAESVQLPADEAPRTSPAGPRSKNPFRSPRSE